MDETYQRIALHARIKDAITRELSNPFVSVDDLQVVKLADDETIGMYHVEARTLPYNIHMFCLAIDVPGHGVSVFFNAGFIRAWIVSPMLEQYTIEHPWIAGV